MEMESNVTVFLHLRRIFTTCHPLPCDMCRHVTWKRVTCCKYSITCQDDLLTVDKAQSHVTAFRPISEAARSWSDDKSSCCAFCGDSNDVCMCRQCTNCSLSCSGYLCQHCEGHQQCVVCRRSLPAYCYSGNMGVGL